MQAYWAGGQYIQNASLADGLERAFVIIKKDNKKWTYVIEIGRSGDSVDIGPLIRDYLDTGKSPGRLFAHTHGKSTLPGWQDDNNYSPTDLNVADEQKIWFGLFSPDGNSQMYKGIDGVRNTPFAFPPPPGVTINRDESFVGKFRRLFEKRN